MCAVLTWKCKSACGHGHTRARVHERMFACKCMFVCAGVSFSWVWVGVGGCGWVGVKWYAQVC